MATKKHATGKRGKTKNTKSKKGAVASAITHKRVAKSARGRGAPLLDSSPDPEDVQAQDLEVPDAAAALTFERREARSAGQSGSLQGLSDLPDAAAESVEELVEEGNVYEAEVVEGVEDASDSEESEVKTHEVPEDDVPEEYLEGE